MLQSGLQVWTYTLPAATPPSVSAYPDIEELRFTTAAPGGFGDCSFTVRIPDARMPQQSLSIFGRVAVMAHGEASGFTGANRAVFLGETTDPEIGLEEGGDYVRVSGLGLGNSLRDDPGSFAYSAKTVKQIVADQLTGYNRPNFLTIDQDQSLIYPDNPAATFAPVYDGNNIEEIIQDTMILAGDYNWGIYGHNKNVDAAGFPTGQLAIMLRDTATVHYQASVQLGDIVGYRVSPSADRAYNVIEIGYNAGNSGFGVATYTDPRLGAGGDQNLAPFRRRKFRRDYSSIATITSTQAQNIANAYGALFKNAPNKVSVSLRAVRDQNGTTIPPWSVQAGRNILIPELAVRGQYGFALNPTAGVNLFYIVKTTYSEDSSGWTLDLDCDNFVDTVEFTVARLQLQADLKQRGGKVTGIYQKQGSAETGYCGVAGHANGAGVTVSQGVNFKTLMVQVPSSITLNADGAGIVNVASTNVSNIGVRGFLLNAVSTALGTISWHGTYQTNGNTLHRVGKTVDWHCSGCDTMHKLLRVGKHIRGHTHHGNVPGASGLAVQCPACGQVEAFNTALSGEDERGQDAHRAGQVKLIRKLMRHEGLGLEVLP